ncbi:MAG: MucB/RseB C-terminal domain-containing protein [Gammaproteobacteria bacterium]|nr:MucB/RseB C-terminal domain-containing protein [Gammaproteobacteria bacterium]
MSLLRLLQRALFGAALLLPLSSFAQSPDPLTLLKEMQQSVRTLTYEGDFVYQFGDVLNAMHIAHSWQNGYEREQLTTLTGVEREIIRQNPGQTDSTGTRVSRRLLKAPTLMTFSPQNLDGVYNFKVLGNDRVAARETTVIAVLPVDDFRYGHRLYLDKETALPLRREVLDKKGKPVSQQMFTSVSITADAATDISVADDAGSEAKYQGPWLFTDLPKGFVMKVYTQGRTNNGHASDHFVFSDGIVRISLFIEDKSTAKLGRRSSAGPVGILGSEVDGHRITIVGEAPVETLKHFLKSAHLQQEGER